MKTLLLICFVVLTTGIAQSAEPMTPDRFKELVARPGDTNALRPELASLPFWKDAKCSVTMKYQDGKVFKEECGLTAKTVAGNYIVFSVDSKYYKQTMHSIAGYDERALAIRLWGLFGDTLVESTMIFDPVKKTSAATSTYTGGFMEISLGSSSDKEMSDRTLVYKDGVLFMTREVRTWPIVTARNVDQGGAADESQPIRSETNRTSSAVAPAEKRANP